MSTVAALKAKHLGAQSLAKGLPLTYEVVTITPGIAKEWLIKNVKNRKISPKHKAQLARAMKSGHWRLTGDAIRFDTKGNLIDGQHRLQACVDADVNFTTMVIYGLQPSDQDVIDASRPRTAGDVLTMHGYHGTNMLGAVCRYIVAIKTNIEIATIKLSSVEILQIVADRPGLAKSLGKVWGIKTTGTPRTQLAVVHYLASVVLDKPDMADAFVDVFRTGIPAYAGCPAHALRERMIRKGDTRNLISRNEVPRAVIHAWNAFAKRETIASFRMPKDVVMHGVRAIDI